jgi:translation initiation factor 1
VAEVCPICGLPKELCVCGAIAKEEAKIKVFTEKRSFGKIVTVIDGIEEKVDPKGLTKKLKKKLACGGTYKNGRIELRGDHKNKVKELLVKEGFPENKIEVE